MAFKKVVPTKYREQEPMLGGWLAQETRCRPYPLEKFTS